MRSFALTILGIILDNGVIKASAVGKISTALGIPPPKLDTKINMRRREAGQQAGGQEHSFADIPSSVGRLCNGNITEPSRNMAELVGWGS